MIGFIICIAVLAYIIYRFKTNMLDSSSNNVNLKDPINPFSVKSLPNKGSITHWGSVDAIASYGDGYVYFKNTTSVIGRYDSNGNVFNKDDKLIGKIQENYIYMDRTYRYDWLRERLKEDECIQSDSCKPPMTKLIGRHNSSYIEDINESMNENLYISVNKNSESESRNVLGSGAAYLISVEDSLIRDDLHSFYQNVQQDCYSLRAQR